MSAKHNRRNATWESKHHIHRDQRSQGVPDDVRPVDASSVKNPDYVGCELRAVSLRRVRFPALSVSSNVEGNHTETVVEGSRDSGAVPHTAVGRTPMQKHDGLTTS